MENQPNQLSLPTCSICNKVYSSMSSLCHNNQKYHPKDNNEKLLHKIPEFIQIVTYCS